MQEYQELTVIIPTLNEEPNIGKLIDRITTLFPGIHIIVADDGSKDRTQEIVKEFHEKNPNVILLDRSKEKIHGLTASVYDSIMICKTPYFFVIDGDFQHPPEKIDDGFKLLRQGCDLVVGYREKVENWGLIRKLISWGATMIGKVSLLIRRRPRVRDIMSGFFGGNTEKVRALLRSNTKITPQGYKILFDILKQTPRNWRLCEFPYVFKNRVEGKSKIGKKHIIAFIKSAIF